jgi:hypothetical protein
METKSAAPIREQEVESTKERMVQSRVKNKEEAEVEGKRRREEAGWQEKVVQTARARAARGAGALTRVSSQLHHQTRLSTNGSRYDNVQTAAAIPSTGVKLDSSPSSP